MIQSDKWKEWVAQLDIKTCLICRTNHGKIYEINDFTFNHPPVHPKCRCAIRKMRGLLAGSATKGEAKRHGWVAIKGNLYKVLPNKMIFGGEYYNDNGKLPSKNGRVWYEADINYKGGYRNDERILFSNDGLIFVTYDHYKTFIEIK